MAEHLLHRAVKRALNAAAAEVPPPRRP
jgi:hypothetical protein